VTRNAFLAIDLADGERHDLAAALAEASPGPPLPGRRTDPANWHITLRFLGECGDEAIDRLVHVLDGDLDVARGRVTCRGLGAFPREAKASVVFVAVTDRDGLLARLAARCDAAAVDAGLPADERPFVPHLTISRLRPAADLRSVFATFGDFSVPVGVHTVSLMRSASTRGRLTYTTLERFPLG
jgi:2'-5' RNA ligase